MLLLRRREKDFMLRRDPKYIDSFKKDYAIMMEDIKDSTYVPAKDKTDVINQMKVYKNDFLTLYEEEVLKGLTYDTGLQGQMRSTVHKTEEQLHNISKTLHTHLNSSIANAERLMYITLILASILTGGLVLYLSNSITGRMKELNSIMKEFSSGEADLTKQIHFKGKDELVELSEYVNEFVNKLRGIFIGVVQGVEKIADENTRIAATVEQFNATFSDQAVQTSGVAAAMEEMSLSSATVSEVIGTMESNTNFAKDKVKEGTQMLAKSVGVINEINEKTSQLRETVSSLANSSNQIGDIISSINDIADQTNLLALNAAIEAARAGEAGRGFAVVADEVRKLAERTQASIKEITDIITELKRETDNTSTNMQEANAKVEEGVRTMDETGHVFNELVVIIDDMISSNDTVAISVSEQVTTVQDVSINTQAISSGVEESAATVEEISRSTFMLSESAEDLKSQISKFKV